MVGDTGGFVAAIAASAQSHQTNNCLFDVMSESFSLLPFVEF